MPRWGKRVLFGCGLLLGIYFFGVIAFWGRFGFRTYLDGKPLTFYTVAEVMVDQLYRTKATELQLVGKNHQVETVLFSDLGVYRVSDLKVPEFEVNPWAWPVSLFVPTQYYSEGELFYRKDQVREAVSSLSCVTDSAATYPEPAHLEQQNGAFVIVPEVTGTKLDKDQVFRAICEALDRYELMVDLEAEDCYFHTQDFEDEDALKQAQSIGNQLLDQKIVVTLDNGVSETVPSEVLQNALLYHNGQFLADPVIVGSYVAELAMKYDTKGMSRTFQTTSDGTIVLEPQQYDNFNGYELDQSETVDRICDAMTVVSDGSPKVQAVWKSTGFGWDQNDDIGDSYLELSLERQHLWLYVDGVCVVDTPVTTGMDVPERATPTGLFYVMEILHDHTMYGSYGSAFVEYFIRVTSFGVGIHDASWRSVYGEDEYIANGSHGCINTPFDAEKQIVETLESMDNYHIPIVIY